MNRYFCFYNMTLIEVFTFLQKRRNAKQVDFFVQVAEKRFP